jgi:ribose/xylose/arabinose/galactoside ABC-type transport system permease subunit
VAEERQPAEGKVSPPPAKPGEPGRALPPWLARTKGFFEQNRGVTALFGVMVLGALFTPQAGCSGPWFANLLTGTADPQAGPPLFLTARIHSDVLYEYAEYGIIAAGMTLVILTGGIDLSVGSIVGISAVLFSLLHIGVGLPAAGAVGLTLLLALGCGSVSGMLTAGAGLAPRRATWTSIGLGVLVAAGLFVKLHAGKSTGVALLSASTAGIVAACIARLVLSRVAIQPFVATLAVMVAARGGAKVLSGGIKVMPGAQDWYYVKEGTPSFIAWMTTPDATGFLRPVTLLFVLSLVVMGLVVAYTRFGRHLYAIGGNEEAARLSGVPVIRSKVTAYMLCGMFSGLAGICNACRTGLGDPEAGFTFELDAIAAVVIGGTSLNGGRGSMFCTLLGTLIVGYINKILSVNAVQESYRLLAKGLIIVAAVVLQSREKAR